MEKNKKYNNYISIHLDKAIAEIESLGSLETRDKDYLRTLTQISDFYNAEIEDAEPVNPDEV